MSRSEKSLSILLVLAAALFLLDGVANSEPKAPTATALVPRPPSALANGSQRSVLLRLRDDEQRQMERLVALRAHMAAGAARDALDRHVVELKREGWMRWLAMQAQFARANGDEARALQAERLIGQVRRPFVPPAISPPQSPEKEPPVHGDEQ